MEAGNKRYVNVEGRGDKFENVVGFPRSRAIFLEY